MCSSHNHGRKGDQILVVRVGSSICGVEGISSLSSMLAVIDLLPKPSSEDCTLITITLFFYRLRLF